MLRTPKGEMWPTMVSIVVVLHISHDMRFLVELDFETAVSWLVVGVGTCCYCCLVLYRDSYIHHQLTHHTLTFFSSFLKIQIL